MNKKGVLEKKTNAFCLTVDDENLAWLSIFVPNNAQNTLQESFIDEMHELFDWLDEQNDIQGLIIYSAKTDTFIVGADIKMIDACTSAEQAQILAQKGQQIFARIESLPFHVVAAIHGPCLGGGLELSLACHSRVATQSDITKLGLPEVKLGLLPGTGGTQRLPRLIGTLAALDLILSGRSLSAKKAKKLGLIDEAVPESILLKAAKIQALKSLNKRKNSVKNWLVSFNPLGRYFVFMLARRKVFTKTRDNYPAVNSIIEVIEFGLAKGIKAGLDFEAERFGQLVMTKASKALRHLFFISMDIKKEKGSEAKPQTIDSVTVLGGGLMGAGISHVSAINAKVKVQIKDLTNEALLKALKYNHNILYKKYQQKRMTHAELEKQMANIYVASKLEHLNQTDLVIEAVFEDLFLKHQMLKEIEESFSSKTIFATNTSSLPISYIASVAKNPDNVIGLHYFSPVEKMPLVEIIPHSGTSDKTIATVMAFAKKQNKTAIVVADKAGFYVNRILAAYLNEAARLLLEGEKIENIDDALMDFGFPVGPFALLDEVGVDVCFKVSPILFDELGERFTPSPLFDLMIENERLGRKTQKGFYRYKNKKKKIDRSIYSLIGIKTKTELGNQEIALRCFLSMLNECARCFDEKVIRSARDGDIGAVFGLGFPPFLGGPFCYMDALSVEKTIKLMGKFERRYGDRFAPCEALLSMQEENRTFYD